MSYTNLEIANALEVIVDLCEERNAKCIGCPLIVEGGWDDYCIFDCSIEVAKERAKKLRGE